VRGSVHVATDILHAVNSITYKDDIKHTHGHPCRS
jgi:hypothetical protein